MKENKLARIRNKNLEELNTEYNRTLNEYTDSYQKYLENITGNDDDKALAEEELKPKIVNLNNRLIKMAEVLLDNNKKSGDLIEKDYELIEELKKNISKTDIKIKAHRGKIEKNEMESDEEKVKIKKKMNNLMEKFKSNELKLTILKVVNFILFILLLLFLIYPLVKNKFVS